MRIQAVRWHSGVASRSDHLLTDVSLGCALFLAYLVVVAWLTWPLATVAGSMLPSSSGDTLYSLWALAWESHALQTAPSSLADANIYWPARDALLYGPTGLGALPFFAPVFWVTANPVLAVNSVLLLELGLTSAALHFVVHRWTGSHAGGLVAAIAFLTTPFVRSTIPSVPHWGALEALPFVVLLGAMPQPSWRSTSALAALAATQCLAEPIYYMPAVVLPLAGLCAYRLMRVSTRAAGLKLLVALLAVGAMLAPLFFAYATVAWGEPNIGRQTLWGQVQASPPIMQLPWDLIGPPGRPIAARPLILATLVLAGLAAVRSGSMYRSSATGRAGWTHSAYWTIAGILLALGPVVLIAGKAIPTPWGFLRELVPALARIRVTQLPSVAGLIGLSLLCGTATAELVHWTSARLRVGFPQPIAAGIVGVIIAVGLTRDRGVWLVPLPDSLFSLRPTLAPATPPRSFLDVLEQTPGPLVELPVAPVPDGSRSMLVGAAYAKRHAEAMFRSTYHWHPILNGYSSYFPASFPPLMALAASLPEPYALDALVRQTGVRFLWLHLAELRGPAREQWEREITGDSGGPIRMRILAREGGEVLIEVARR